MCLVMFCCRAWSGSHLHRPPSTMQSYCRVATNRIRSLSFWSRSPPPYTEFSLVSPVPSSTAYTPDIIPRHILRPPYAQTGQVDLKLIPKTPVLWSEIEIDKVSRTTSQYLQYQWFFSQDPQVLSACEEGSELVA